MLLIAAVTCMNLVADEWDEWRDGRRVLLVRAVSPEDVRLKRQPALLSAEAEGLAVRDVVVLKWMGEADCTVWPSGESVSVTALPRKIQAGLRNVAWKVLLIGRDGGVKVEWNKVVPPEQIFAKIDAMPMGRSEKRVRESNAGR